MSCSRLTVEGGSHVSLRQLCDPPRPLSTVKCSDFSSVSRSLSGSYDEGGCLAAN